MLQHKLLLAILTLTLTLGGTPAAQAAGPETRGRWAYGQVTAIDGDSLTLQTRHAELALLTGEETIFEVPGVQDATLVDIATGDLVAVHAVRREDGVPLARLVAVIPAGSLEDETLYGLVLDVDGTSLQLLSRRERVTVTTGENTLFRVPNVENATAADLTKKPVVALGRYEEKRGRVFHASAVAVVPRRILERHMAWGRLAAVEGETLVLTTGCDGEGERRVQTTGETTFCVPGVENASLVDLKVGQPILAPGHKDENGDFVARRVIVAPLRPRRAVARGEVTAVGDNDLTLETPGRGALTVRITGQTRFRLPGTDDPGLDDIAVGDRIVVAGHRDRDGNLVAREVGKLPEKIEGTVTAIQETSFQIDTAGGPVTVHTDENTRFHIPGDDDPGLDDIAAGWWRQDGALLARRVVRPRPEGETQAL